MSGAGKGGGRGFCDGGDRFAMEDHFHKADPPETMPDQEGVPVRAVCRNKEDGFFFSYFAEGTEVNLFLSRGSAWMQRGTVRSARMVFDPSASSTRCSYETAYGIIPMEIRTEGISVMAGGLRRKSVESRKSIADDRDSKRNGNLSGDFFRAARSLPLSPQKPTRP